MRLKLLRQRPASRLRGNIVILMSGLQWDFRTHTKGPLRNDCANISKGRVVTSGKRMIRRSKQWERTLGLTLTHCQCCCILEKICLGKSYGWRERGTEKNMNVDGAMRQYYKNVHYKNVLPSDHVFGTFYAIKLISSKLNFDLIFSIFQK